MFNPSILRVMAITGAAPQANRYDADRYDRNFIDRIVAAANGGATSLQIRFKQTPARLIAEITRAVIERVDVPVLVNDRFDVALAAGAAGVHTGTEDIAVADIRRLVPPGFIIGTSVGCDDEIPNSALADYVGIGPVYETPTKADAGPAIGSAELSRLARATGKPTIAIGGITTGTATALLTPNVIDAGVQGIAVVGAIYSAAVPEAIAAAARTLRDIVDAATSNRGRL